MLERTRLIAEDSEFVWEGEDYGFVRMRPSDGVLPEVCVSLLSNGAEEVFS